MTRTPKSHMDSVEIAAEKLAEPAKKILNVFSNNHGIYRGSHEDTITLAQGAMMIDNWSLVRNKDDIKINHDTNLKNDKNTLESKRIEIVTAIGVIKGIDEATAISVSKALGGFINFVRYTKDGLQMTLDYADDVKASRFKDRMKGVYFVAGGRDVANLVSQQYKDIRYKEIRKINNSK